MRNTMIHADSLALAWIGRQRIITGALERQEKKQVTVVRTIGEEKECSWDP
jgi:hypothetical protein